MPPRLLTLALLWFAMAALLSLLPLLWALRGAGSPAATAALVLNTLLLPVPVGCLFALRRSADAATRRAVIDGKTQLLGQVSQEIRTPMNAVMGTTQLALQTQLTPEQRALLTQTDAASRALLGLVNDVLDVAKIDAGQLQIESLPMRLEDVVAQSVEAVRPVRANPNVTLTCDWADASLLGPRGQLLGDPLRLQQVLVNLLSNALKFTPAGHVVLRIAAPAGEAQGQVPLCVTVQDTGIGMDAEQLALLLGPGQHGNGTMPWRYGGTGLGLALTQRLVQLMGGSLDAHSQPGQGSRFDLRVTLPLDPHGLAPAPLRPQRLLLAKAKTECREATLALLRHLGLGLGLASSADTASTRTMLDDARHSGQPFDWLLLDWQLPGQGTTAAELLAQLRRDHPALRIAAICPPETGNGSDAAQAQPRALGARALCASPLLPADLRRLLSDAPVGGHPAGADAQSLAGLRVLLVEDHPINQEIALRLLGSRGAKVELASNGQQALDLLQARGPAAFDLVLMDLQMPVLDGLSATRRLRQLPEFNHLPVLAMTAHALAEERAQCLSAGMQGHIAKPLDVARLVHELQRYRPRPETPAAATATAALSLVLDQQLGLRQFDGQAALYRRTLQGFADQYAAGLTAWHGWLAKGDWPELRRAAHTLQGLAATLGARPLHQAALALERSAATANPTHAESQLDRVAAGLALLQGEITAALAGAWGHAAPRVSGPGDVQELRQLLAQSDSRALDWWQAHGSQTPMAPALRQQLEDALAVLDFDAAALALAPPPEAGR